MSNKALSHDQLPFELYSLSQAKRYQSWILRSIAPYLGSRIMEIGAGIGNLSKSLPIVERLVITEIDPKLLALLRVLAFGEGPLDSRISIKQLDLSRDEFNEIEEENLDTIVSFNVLEHIENDRDALSRLCNILRKSQAQGPKRLVTFVPAHPWAYGGMDKAFGHYRRYSHRTIAKIASQVAPEAKLTCRYINIFGLVGWFINGRIFKKSSIGMTSIRVFEALCSILIPIDNFIHNVFGLQLGQSLLFVLEWNSPNDLAKFPAKFEPKPDSRLQS